jgi:hypothetical protein
MRRKASQPPFQIPNLSIATRPYSEQVGVKRQHGPFKGESASW